MKPVNEALDSRLQKSKGNLIILAFRQLLKLSIDLSYNYLWSTKFTINKVNNLNLIGIIDTISTSSFFFLNI